MFVCPGPEINVLDLQDKIVVIQKKFPHVKVLPTVDQGYKIKLLTEEQEKICWDIIYNRYVEAKEAPMNAPIAPDFNAVFKTYVEQTVDFYRKEIEKQLKDLQAKSEEKLNQFSENLLKQQKSFEEQSLQFQTKFKDVEKTVVETFEKSLASKVGEMNTKVENAQKWVDTEVKRLEKYLEESMQDIQKELTTAFKEHLALEITRVQDEQKVKEQANIQEHVKMQEGTSKIIAHLQNVPKI